MRQLIINADDFGLAPSVNEAIVRCFDAGRLSSATLMVNGPAAGEALGHARRQSSHTIGLHLNLIHFSPLTDCSLLAGPSGFRGLAALVTEQLMRADALYVQVRAELEAQLAEFQSVAGRAPSHVDTHLWAQVLPAVFQAIVDVATARRIPAVRNIEGGNPLAALARALRIGGAGSGNVWRASYQAAKAIWFKGQSRWCHYPARLRSRGLFTPDHYFGVSEGLLYQNVETRLRVIEACLSTLPAVCTSEFMVHPGGEAHPDGVWYRSADARIETETLLSDRLLEVMTRQRVTLLDGYGPGRKEDSWNQRLT